MCSNKAVRFCREAEWESLGQLSLKAVRVLDSSVMAECEPMGFKVGEVWFLNPEGTPFTEDQLSAAKLTLRDLIGHCKNDKKLPGLLSLFSHYETDVRWHIHSKEVEGGTVISGIVGSQKDFDGARELGYVKL